MERTRLLAPAPHLTVYQRLPSPAITALILALFVVGHVALDWASYIHPLQNLNITVWNPTPALALVVLQRFRWRAWGPLFVAMLVGTALVTGAAAPSLASLCTTLMLTLGYAALAEIMVRRIPPGCLLDDRGSLLAWVLIIVPGTLLNSMAYLGTMVASGQLPLSGWLPGVLRYWVGDAVGIIVVMPFILWLADPVGRARLAQVLPHWETLGYILLATAALAVAFGQERDQGFKFFYLLFLPLVWAATRQGTAGASFAAVYLQGGVILASQWRELDVTAVAQLQILAVAMTLVAFFVGAVVDEQRRISAELRHSLRLAAAGEMAGALAHELNQPLTALAAYGQACEKLLQRGETGPLLASVVARMVTESGRAAEVIRRLRDFFRTGATQLQALPLAALIEPVCTRFADRASREGVDFQVTPLPTHPLTLYADPLQMEVVLRNLLANAFEAAQERAPDHGQAQVRLTAVADDDEGVRIEITDNGPGVNAARAHLLFEPFQSTKSSGLGLGLAISRAIAEAHGGTLKSELGKGGKFCLWLPVEAPPAPDPNQPPVEEEHAPATV